MIILLIVLVFCGVMVATGATPITNFIYWFKYDRKKIK